jgi:hypothetical protein
MAAAPGRGGGEAFRLSADAGAGALKLQKGDITLWSVDGATDAIVRPSFLPSLLIRSLPRSLPMLVFPAKEWFESDAARVDLVGLVRMATHSCLGSSHARRLFW